MRKGRWEKAKWGGEERVIFEGGQGTRDRKVGGKGGRKRVSIESE